MRRLQERRAVTALKPARSGPVPEVARRPTRGLVLGSLTALAVVAADQVAKTLALDSLADGPTHLVWTLQLRLAFNKGAAFGIGTGVAPVLVAAGIVLLVVLLGLGRRADRSWPTTVALALVVGGALGNLVDRLVRHHGGAVVDFIDLKWWPVFNLADAAITCGAVLVVLTSRPNRRPPTKGRERA